MVLLERLSEEPDNSASDEDADTEDWSDGASSTTSQDQEDNNCCKDGGLDVVAANGSCPGSFGNVVVKNSSEVHFGNKTFYQGPVTIKQFLYNNGASDSALCIEQSGIDNPSLVTDSATSVPTRVCANTDNTTDNTKKIYSHFNETEEIKKDGRSSFLRSIIRHRKTFAITTCVLLLMIFVLLTTLIVTNNYVNTTYGGSKYPEDSSEQEKNTPIDFPIDPDANITLSGKLRIISRFEWVAQPPAEAASPLRHPVPFVVIMHTATENCSDQASCTFHVRYIQTFHIESKNWWDIGYNFLVGGDGFAYEGRGWKGEGAFAFGYNSRAIGIAFIGTFNNILPPKRQILAAQQLIEMGVKKGYISTTYKLLAHRQLSPTQSPGEKLYENIKTWPHWANTPGDET